MDIEKVRERLVTAASELAKKEESTEARSQDILTTDDFWREFREGKTDTERRIVRDSYYAKDEEWRKRDQERRRAKIEYITAKEDFDTLARMFEVGACS